MWGYNGGNQWDIMTKPWAVLFFNGEQHGFNPQTWSSKQQKQQKLVDTL